MLAENSEDRKFIYIKDDTFFVEGPWTSSGVLATAFFRPENSSYGGTYETLQLQIFQVMLGADGPDETVRLFGFKPELAPAIFGNVAGKAGVTITITLQHPLSRGTVTLRSLNPLDKPVITMNYLEDDEDVQELIKGVRITQQLMETTPFKQLDATLAIDSHPNCGQHAPDSDDFWECYIRELTSTEYHYTTTCRMGSNPVDSVVSYELKVHGIKRLRVVDASVMPIAITANTMATTVMIAEKAADIIQGITTV